MLGAWNRKMSEHLLDRPPLGLGVPYPWHNLVKIPVTESFEEVLLHKKPWLNEMVGQQMIDWSIISTGYIWFKRKEDKVMFILRWGE